MGSGATTPELSTFPSPSFPSPLPLRLLQADVSSDTLASAASAAWVPLLAWKRRAAEGLVDDDLHAAAVRAEWGNAKIGVSRVGR